MARLRNGTQLGVLVAFVKGESPICPLFSFPWSKSKYT